LGGSEKWEGRRQNAGPRRHFKSADSMEQLFLHEFHKKLGACFIEVNGAEVVENYGDFLAEHGALHRTVVVLDLSFRSRICLTGKDRATFLHGQVTNDVKRLKAGDGCYAALTNAKARMESDLNIYALQDELLLDFEPGLKAKVSERLEKYIIAEDVQVVDVSALYGLLSVQGPAAEAVVREVGLFPELPQQAFGSVKFVREGLGEIYVMNQARLGWSVSARKNVPLTPALSPSDRERGNPGQAVSQGPPADSSSGFDLFVPVAGLEEFWQPLIAAAKLVGGGPCGWQAFEVARIEAGIPRFGADMDETNLPLEAGLEDRAISFKKGCYIGQEVISRIKTYGHVNKTLRGLMLADELKNVPDKGDKLFHSDKEIGYVTSAAASPSLGKNIALGYVRKEVNEIGTELRLRTGAGEFAAKIVELPFRW